jgi:hypothetical protein
MLAGVNIFTDKKRRQVWLHRPALSGFNTEGCKEVGTTFGSAVQFLVERFR